MIEHFPYYVKRLRSVPYGAVRRITRRKCHAYSIIEPFLIHKHGLEIGGPSPCFRGNRLVPVYDRCQQIDNCDFSRQTLWTNAAEKQGLQTVFGKRYITDACDLQAIPDASYDFVAASHVLEHTANPLRALQEWKRVLRPGGALLVLVPRDRQKMMIWTTDARSLPSSTSKRISSRTPERTTLPTWMRFFRFMILVWTLGTGSSERVSGAVACETSKFGPCINTCLARKCWQPCSKAS